MALRKRLWFRLTLLALLGAVVWLSTVYHQISTQAARDEVRPADAIVVFGAAEYAGHPSPVFRSRLDHAVALYRRHIAPLVITTGGAGEDPHFSEGGVGRSYLVTQGIPENAIIAETQGNDTSESAQRVGNIMRTNHLRSCVAVSDGYHLFRIKKMLGNERLEVYCSPRADAGYPGLTRRFLIKMRETLAYTWWKLGLD